MVKVLSKFKRQDDEFAMKIGIEHGWSMRNIKRISNDMSTAAVMVGNDNKRTKTVCMRDLVSIHPEFLKECCHFDPVSAIFRIKQRKRALYLKFPVGKKCWECGIVSSSSDSRSNTLENFGGTRPQTSIPFGGARPKTSTNFGGVRPRTSNTTPPKIVKIQTCTDCRKGKYCSVKCQVSNWDNHKDFCKKLLKLNNEIKTITITNGVVQDMNFVFGKSPSGDILTPLGFEDDFGERGFDEDTIEIIMKTGREICRSIARTINDLRQRMK